MNYLFDKLKSLSAGMLALSFLFAVTLTSCGTVTQSDDDGEEATEQAEGSNEEHPAGEHPAGEHPSSDEEHPSDSTESEHPEGEHPDSDDDTEEGEEENDSDS